MPDKLNRLSLYIKKHCTPKKELKKLSLLRVECKLKIIKKVHLYKYTYRVQQTRNEKISTYSYSYKIIIHFHFEMPMKSSE